MVKSKERICELDCGAGIVLGFETMKSDKPNRRLRRKK